MLIFYSGSGSVECQVLEPELSEEAWTALRASASRLLIARNQQRAAEMLRKFSFEVRRGTNYFQDEFCLLHMAVSIEKYVELEEHAKSKDVRVAYGQIARTITELGPYIRFISADVLMAEGLAPVESPTLLITSAIVEHALADAEALIRDRGALSGLDRVHTAFHGYLKTACDAASIPFSPDSSITTLFKALREQHPALTGRPIGPTVEIDKIVRTLSSVVDALNPLRNRNSIAHPNEQLLDEAEAMLTINSVRTLLHYLDARLRR